MKKTTKALLMAACALALVLTTVMGTVAYLTNTATVKNTFTVGNVKITLDEAKVNTDGTYADEGATRVDNNAYHLLPGHKYIKDPTIKVDSESEDCYLFVKVENGFADGIEAATESVADGYKTIADQMKEKNWKPIEEGSEIYYLAASATDAAPVAKSAGENVVIFDEFKISGDADLTSIVEKDDTTDTPTSITVTAYAVQADGFEGKTASEIWNAAFAATNP